MKQGGSWKRTEHKLQCLFRIGASLNMAADADQHVSSQVFSEQGDRKPSHLCSGSEPAGLAALPLTDSDQPASPLVSPTASQVLTGFQLDIDCRPAIRQEVDTSTVAHFLSGFHWLGAAHR